ncbi:PDR/VanB family oxidoreductase [Nocardia sp. NPDC051911]|uniref:PDR/VanB family oxidoreductase n=1 Tax=Nocardia sp. NPDC051911 TaxID=3154648 RepID=UPI003434D406
MNGRTGEESPQLRVVTRDNRVPGVVVLTLEDAAGRSLPEWEPGAHIDLVLGPGLVRQYSLCGDPDDRKSFRVAVLRENPGRGGSARVHDELRIGSLIEARGPRNRFPLEPAESYVFIAGGIGITPILPMLYRARAAGAECELHYGGRSRSSMAFAAELAEHPDLAAVLYPQDEVGLIDLATILGSPRHGTLIYACGPEPLLDAVDKHCRGWPEGSLHVERFRAPEPGDDMLAESFEVDLAVTGLTLSVPPDKSVLEVACEAGVPVLSSCQEGTCGTCEVRVLEGEVDHRDSILTPAERAAHDTMFVCVSRAVGPRLVLDL